MNYRNSLCLAALLASATAAAQVPGTADVSVNYTLPTKNLDGTDIPATGLSSLSKTRLYLSNSAIPSDVSSLQPTLETAIGTSAVVPAFSTSIGSTIHVRVVVCNAAGGCSPASSEATVLVVAKTPGSAVVNTVTISIK